MKHVVLWCLTIIAIAVAVTFLRPPRGPVQAASLTTSREPFQVGPSNPPPTQTAGTLSGAFAFQAPAGRTVPENVPEKEVRGTIQARWESATDHINETCHNPMLDAPDHVANRPFKFIRSETDEARILPLNEYNSRNKFAVFGDSPTLQTYEAQFGKLADEINRVQQSENVPVVQDPRCDFVKRNLPNSDEYIFFNENKLLTHPDGPMEPDLCYIPPHVANVLFDENLCSNNNALVYDPAFASIVEVQGLDVSARVDKDIGTPMCVLKFKSPEESGLPRHEFTKKLQEYLQFLYASDPKIQFIQQSQQWISNKHYANRKIIELHSSETEFMQKRLAALQDQLDKLRKEVGIRIDEAQRNEDDGYMQRPALFVVDYLDAGVYRPGDVPDVNHETSANRARHMADVCAETGSVGNHLLHLGKVGEIDTVLDTWTNYTDDLNRKTTLAEYVNEKAVYDRVWDRASPDDLATKQEMCESIIELASGQTPHGGLGFERTDVPPNDHFLLRESKRDITEKHFRDMCTWDELTRLDTRNENDDLRTESCDWATGGEFGDSGPFEHNCTRYGALFKERTGANRYFEELKKALAVDGDDPGAEIVRADSEVTKFLVDPGASSGFAAFDEETNADGTCISRDEGDRGQACEAVYNDRFPIAPGTTVALKGKGAIDPGADYADETDRTDPKNPNNFTWGPNLIIEPDADNRIKISGRPASAYEDKLKSVLTTSEPSALNSETVVTLNDGFEIVSNRDKATKRLVAVASGDLVAGPNYEPAGDHIKVAIADENHYLYNRGRGTADYVHEYDLGTATCVIDGKMMVVDKDVWVAAPENVIPGNNIKVSRVFLNEPEDPRDSTVACELDGVREGAFYKAIKDQQQELELSAYECEVVNPTPTETVHVGTEKLQQSYISPDIGEVAHYYTFSKKPGGETGIFTKQNQAGFIRLDATGRPAEISADGTGTMTSSPTNLDPKRYEYEGDGRFVEFPGDCVLGEDNGPTQAGLYHYVDGSLEKKNYNKYKYDQSGNELEPVTTCEDISGACRTDSGPGTPGLYHVTDGVNPKVLRGLYLYTDAPRLENSLALYTGGTGVRYVDHFKGVIQAATNCDELEKVSKQSDCLFANQTCPEVNVRPAIGMDKYLHHDQLGDKYEYNVRQGYSIFSHGQGCRKLTMDGLEDACTGEGFNHFAITEDVGNKAIIRDGWWTFEDEDKDFDKNYKFNDKGDRILSLQECSNDELLVCPDGQRPFKTKIDNGDEVLVCNRGMLLTGIYNMMTVESGESGKYLYAIKDGGGKYEIGDLLQGDDLTFGRLQVHVIKGENNKYKLEMAHNGIGGGNEAKRYIVVGEGKNLVELGDATEFDIKSVYGVYKFDPPIDSHEMWKFKVRDEVYKESSDLIKQAEGHKEASEHTHVQEVAQKKEEEEVVDISKDLVPVSVIPGKYQIKSNGKFMTYGCRLDQNYLELVQNENNAKYLKIDEKGRIAKDCEQASRVQYLSASPLAASFPTYPTSTETEFTFEKYKNEYIISFDYVSSKYYLRNEARKLVMPQDVNSASRFELIPDTTNGSGDDGPTDLSENRVTHLGDDDDEVLEDDGDDTGSYQSETQDRVTNLVGFYNMERMDKEKGFLHSVKDPTGGPKYEINEVDTQENLTFDRFKVKLTLNNDNMYTFEMGHNGKGSGGGLERFLNNVDAFLHEANAATKFIITKTEPLNYKIEPPIFNNNSYWKFTTPPPTETPEPHITSPETPDNTNLQTVREIQPGEYKIKTGNQYLNYTCEKNTYVYNAITHTSYDNYKYFHIDHNGHIFKICEGSEEYIYAYYLNDSHNGIVFSSTNKTAFKFEQDGQSYIMRCEISNITYYLSLSDNIFTVTKNRDNASLFNLIPRSNTQGDQGTPTVQTSNKNEFSIRHCTELDCSKFLNFLVPFKPKRYLGIDNDEIKVVDYNPYDGLKPETAIKMDAHTIVEPTFNQQFQKGYSLQFHNTGKYVSANGTNINNNNAWDTRLFLVQRDPPKHGNCINNNPCNHVMIVGKTDESDKYKILTRDHNDELKWVETNPSSVDIPFLLTSDKLHGQDEDAKLWAIHDAPSLARSLALNTNIQNVEPDGKYAIYQNQVNRYLHVLRGNLVFPMTTNESTVFTVSEGYISSPHGFIYFAPSPGSVLNPQFSATSKTKFHFESKQSGGYILSFQNRINFLRTKKHYLTIMFTSLASTENADSAFVFQFIRA